MTRTRKASLGLLVCTVALWSMAFSCNQHNLILMEHDFKSSVAALQQAEVNEFQAGNVDAATHQQIQTIVLQLAQGGQQIAVLLQQNATKQTVLSEVNLINQSLQDLLANGVLHVKNPTTQANLRIMLQAIQDIVNNFSTALGSAPQTMATVTGGAN